MKHCIEHLTLSERAHYDDSVARREAALWQKVHMSNIKR